MKKSFLASVICLSVATVSVFFCKLSHPQKANAGVQLSAYCPVQLFTMYNGLYYYAAWARDMNDCTTLYVVTDTKLHNVTPCPFCPDPVMAPGHFGAVPETKVLEPIPDPMFSK